MSAEEYNPPRGRKIGSVKLPKVKRKKVVATIPFSSAIAQANHNKKVSETAIEKAMVNQATEKDPARHGKTI
jgi:hypothetical protein